MTYIKININVISLRFLINNFTIILSLLKVCIIPKAEYLFLHIITIIFRNFSESFRMGFRIFFENLSIGIESGFFQIFSLFLPLFVVKTMENMVCLS